MMAVDPNHEEAVEGEIVAVPSRALVVHTVQLSSVTLTPLLTVLAAQLSSEALAETYSSYSTAVQSYRAAAARVPHSGDTSSEDN